MSTETHPKIYHDEAARLIAYSESHDTIARADYSTGLHNALIELCDDWQDTNEGRDYWADGPSSRDDDMAWRVELRR